MKDHYLRQLRNKQLPIEEFRKNAYLLSKELAGDSLKKIPNHENPLLVIILRSGFAILPAFMELYPQAKIAVIGIFRDEKTAKPNLYYENFPLIQNNQPIFLLDPMIATGQSANLAIELLIKQGACEEQITLFSFIGAKDGLKFLKEHHPKIDIQVAGVDPELDHHFMIIPGLGDFGDRYFGT